MPVKPPPYKAICKKCHTSKIVAQKSDALNPLESFPICPKCGKPMEDRGEINAIDIVLNNIKNIFDKPKYPKYPKF